MGACGSKILAEEAQEYGTHCQLAAGAASAYSSSADSATPSAVKVAVIVRPLLPLETERGCAATVSVAGHNTVCLLAHPGRVPVGNDGPAEFEYNRVYHATDVRAGLQLYLEMVAPVVERFTQGFNACVLAYGQTGSGKTHQMQGSSSMPRERGAAVLPQACSQLLKYMQAAGDTYDLQLKATYVELYNEQIQDLLSPSAVALATSTGSASNLAAVRAVYGSGGFGSPRSQSPGSGAWPSSGSATSSAAGSDSGGSSGGGGGITLYETPSGQIVLDGVTEAAVTCAADIIAVLSKGAAVRATAQHKLNQQSSRSHAILTLMLSQRAHASAAKTLPPELRCLCSKLHLVDLAGSERVKETGATGTRFTESISINRGLLELGNVINALTEGASRKHIPYRNSKLTRLLQDSLGGSSETLFLACVSPADSNRDHTLSTLRYASRAMAIKNSLQRATMGAAEELVYLRDLVGQLQAENVQLKRALTGGAGGSTKGGRKAAAAAAQQQQQQVSVQVHAGYSYSAGE